MTSPADKPSKSSTQEMADKLHHLLTKSIG